MEAKFLSSRVVYQPKEPAIFQHTVSLEEGMIKVGGWIPGYKMYLTCQRIIWTRFTVTTSWVPQLGTNSSWRIVPRKHSDAAIGLLNKAHARSCCSLESVQQLSRETDFEADFDKAIHRWIPTIRFWPAKRATGPPQQTRFMACEDQRLRSTIPS